MITVAIFGIIVVFLAYIAQFRQTHFGLKISFFLIFLFLALRYDYGNDYHGYLRIFLNIDQTAVDFLKGLWPDRQEWQFGLAGSKTLGPGWLALCALFQPLGFFAMITVLALFNCIVYHHFITKYVPPAYYSLAVFLYVFNPQLMLVQSSAMRQSVAISIFLISIDYIYKKDLIRYILLICVAVSFHSTAILMVPVYLLGLVNLRISKPIAIGCYSIFLLLFLFADSLTPVINLILGTYVSRYGYYEAGTIRTGLLVVFYSVFLMLLLLYEKFQNNEISILYKIAILGIWITPFALIVMMIGRVGMYFHPILIAVYPLILLDIKNVIFKRSLLGMIVFMILYNYYGFFQSDTWRIAFSTYQTIFSSPYIY